MKMETHLVAAAPLHAHHHEHGSLSGYLLGFLLSCVLTAIPFWLVMSGELGNRQITALAIVACAAVQIVVHMVCFLHMNSSSEGGWTMMALIFTIVIVAIALSGSLWIINHLNSNMMPAVEMSGMQ